MTIEAYRRDRAVEYARRWAYERNDLFPDFAGIGGDCTNFVSQCIFAGSCVMNYSPMLGWYYISLEDRSPSWSGVEFFYDFMTRNQGPGPFAREVLPGGLSLGDVIQLGQEDGDYYHTLVITGVENNEFLVSAHSIDTLDRTLSSYEYSGLRYIHIDGVRYDMELPTKCFDDLIAGISLGIV